jgi:hypothetical protein
MIDWGFVFGSTLLVIILWVVCWKIIIFRQEKRIKELLEE